ncbi:MAG: phage holin family protein [Verrucomicrobiales bacterium]|nr:phage holin family protein [Verrucomicrobiales bacterium]
MISPRFETEQIGARTDDPRSGSAEPGVLQLLRTLWEQLQVWAEQEFALAKSEVKEKVKVIANGFALVVVALAAATAGLFLVILALAAAVGIAVEALGVETKFAYLIGFTTISFVCLLVGISLFKSAKSRLSAENLKPQRTVESLKQTADWALQKIQ